MPDGLQSHLRERPKSAPVVPIDSGGHRQRIIQRRNELVEANLGMLEPMARRLLRRMPPCYTLQEVIAAGEDALMSAALKYRPDTEASFRTYARYAVRGAMLELLRRKKLRDAMN